MNSSTSRSRFDSLDQNGNSFGRYNVKSATIEDIDETDAAGDKTGAGKNKTGDLKVKNGAKRDKRRPVTSKGAATLNLPREKNGKAIGADAADDAASIGSIASLMRRKTPLASTASLASLSSMASPTTVARHVHVACGWRGLTPNLERIKNIHERHGDEIVEMEFSDEVWTRAQQPLMTASISGDADIVEFFISRGADVNQRRLDGAFPLLEAALKDNADVCSALLSSGAVPDAATPLGQTALRVAIRDRKSSAAAALIEGGASLSAATNCDEADEKFEESLLKMRDELKTSVEKRRQTKDDEDDADPSVDDSVNDADVAGIEARVDVAVARRVHDACGWKGRLSDLDALERLREEYGDAMLTLRHGDDDWPTMTPLHTAAVVGDANVVAALVNWGADVNAVVAGGVTPLHQAASNGHPIAVADLLRGGATVDAPDAAGGTPLRHAIRGGHAHVVATLLQNGADLSTALNFRDLEERRAQFRKLCAMSDVVTPVLSDGDAALFRIVEEETAPMMNAARRIHEACGWRGAPPDEEEIGRLHTRFGAAILSASFSDGEWRIPKTPLMTASIEGNYGVAKLLISLGADVNDEDDNSATPLHCAASNGHGITCRLLIESGAAVDALTRGGETPLRLAVRRRHGDAARTLRGAGASLKKAALASVNQDEWIAGLEAIKSFIS